MNPAAFRLHCMLSAQRARESGFHAFAASLVDVLHAEESRCRYGRVTVAPADRQAFAHVEAPVISPALDR